MQTLYMIRCIESEYVHDVKGLAGTTAITPIILSLSVVWKSHFFDPAWHFRWYHHIVLLSHFPTPKLLRFPKEIEKIEPGANIT